MASGGDSEVLLLLEQYCRRRSDQDRDLPRLEGAGDYFSSAASSSLSFFSTTVPALFSYRSKKPKHLRSALWGLESDSVEKEHDDSDSESQSRSSAVERLVQITEAAPVPQVYVESQDEIVQKLVNLMIMFGDDINQKIAQTPLLQQQLSNMNYELFEKVTSTVQSLVDSNPGRAAGSRSGSGFESEAEVQQQKIAWAFEVTSRLSVVGVVQRRRVLSFGDKYIQQHHSAWVQQHGGWDEVFAVD